MPSHSIGHSIPQSSTPQPRSQQTPVMQPLRAASVSGTRPQTPSTPQSQLQSGQLQPPQLQQQTGVHQMQVLSVEDNNDEFKPLISQLWQETTASSVSQPDTQRSNTPVSSASDQGSVPSGKVFPFSSQKSIGNDLPGETKMDVDSTEVKHEIETGIKTEVKEEIKIEIKQEPMDEGNMPSAASATCKEEVGSVKEEPSTPLSTASTGDTHVDIKQGPSTEASQPPPKLRPNQKVFNPDELRQALMPTLEKLYRQVPESLPFRQPVDPNVLQIPDYFDIIKKPMDLSTIIRKLDTGQYQDPWQYVEDFWLMFDNAWFYNRKTSHVYRYCTKLAEVFKQEIDPVMQSLGYCCGQKYVFQPQVLCCYGKQLCTIPRDAKCWGYQNRYTYCQKCFSEIPGDTVALRDDPGQPQTVIKKEQFVEMKNDHLEQEPFVECNECGRKLHQICVLHFDSIWPEGFTCENCLKSKGRKRKENKFTSKRLPQTKLGSYIESLVNVFLKKEDCGAGEVTIRVVSSSDKVMPRMRCRYGDTGKWSKLFPYHAKALFAFEEIDGVDTCFFGMHVQEYGSECAMPDTRGVYIAYLDSVPFFRPEQFQTAVCHEILLGYLDYAKQLGYTMAYIGVCPPSKGIDYIFHCHPAEQKFPKLEQLHKWFKKMLDKGIMDRTVLEYKDVLNPATEDNLHSASELPYFGGDFCPNVLESIKELDQEEEEKRKAEASAAAFSSEANRNAEEGLNVFFVICLHSVQAAASLPHIQDPDPFINCDMMDGRDAFLTLAREKHYEFSSLRRTKYSTMAMLYELHNRSQDRFVYTCNNCKTHVEMRYHCTVCDDFDLCINCFDKEGHPHKMETLGFDLVDWYATPQEFRRPSIQCCIQSLVHVCQCHDANCRLPRPSCQKMKRVVQHAKCCKQKTNGSCPFCKQLIALGCYHAKHCQEAKCPVPFCLNIKLKLRQQKLQQRLQQAQILKRRIETMQNRGPPGSVPQPSPGNSNSSSQPSPSAPPHTSPHPPQPGIGMKPSTGPPVAALQAVQQVQAAVAARQPTPHMVPAGVNYGKGNPVISPPTGNPSVMPSQQMQAQMQKPVGGQMMPGVPNRMLQGIGGMSSWDESGYNPQGIQGQPHQPPQPQQPQQMGIRQPNQLIGPGGVSNTMGNPGPPMGPPQGLPGPGPAQSIPRPTQALQQLLQTLKSPTSPQQQQQVLQILKSNPQLMAAFIKRRRARQQAQQQQQQHQMMIGEGNVIAPPPTQGQVQQLWYQKQQQQQHLLAMQRQQAADIQQTQPNPGLAPADMQRAYAALGLPYNAGGSTSLNQVMQRGQNVGVRAADIQQTQPNPGLAPADMQRAYAALGLPYNAGGSTSLNQVMQRGQNVGVRAADIQQTQPNPGLAPADMQRAYAALGLPYNAGGSTSLNQVMQRGQNVGVRAADIQQTQPNPGLAPADMQRAYAALGLPYNAGGSTSLNQVMQRGQNVGVRAADIQQTQPNPGLAPADMQRAYAALGLPYNAGGSTSLNQVMQRGQNVGVRAADIQQTQPNPGLAPADMQRAYAALGLPYNAGGSTSLNQVMQRGQNVGVRGETKMDVDSTEVKHEIESEIKTEIKEEIKMEIKQEPMDEGNMPSATSATCKEEVGPVKEEPLTPLSTASTWDANVDIKQEPSTEAPQPPPKLRPNEKGSKMLCSILLEY